MIRVPVGLLLLTMLASCSSAPGTVEAPDVDPGAAAKAAIKQYDDDGDQQLSAAEVAGSSLASNNWDADGNGSLDQSEIEARLQRYLEAGTGLVGLQCTVLLNGRPLPGAQVTFEPEEFLGGAVHPATGTTGNDGTATLAIAEEFRPRPNLDCVEIGLYRVKIIHPDANLAREFNVETRLAYDVSPLEELVPPVFHVRQ